MKELAKITETFTESVIREMTRICDAVGGYNLSQGFFLISKVLKLSKKQQLKRLMKVGINIQLPLESQNLEKQ